jgi:hypothetical protein
MSARIEIGGMRFGRWTVLDYAGGYRWNCRCDCGTERAVHGGSLRRGITNGCIKCHPGRGSRRTHGQKRTRLYNIWSNMIGRCENTKDAAFQNYGGRGISICPGWRMSFETFRDWALSNGYEPHLTIDRRDNDGNYEPGNCRWITYAEQNRNYRRNRPIEYLGRTVLVCDLAAEVGLPQDVLKNRIFRYGWPVELAVKTPVLAPGQRRPSALALRNIDA